MVMLIMQLPCTMAIKNAKGNYKRRPDRDKLYFILNQGGEVPKQSSFQVSVFNNLTVFRDKIKSEVERFNIML